MAVLKVDDYVMRTYSNKQGETIGLYIGYFEVQREGMGIHSPRQCLPGVGWSIIKHSEYQLSMKGHNPSVVPINLHLMGKGNQRQLYLIWDAMTKRRTDGALVRVNMPVNPDLDRALQTQMDFINLFVSMLVEYIPD